MKKYFYLSIAAITLLFSSVACSDDDDPNPNGKNQQLKEVISKLEGMDDYSTFTDVLKKASTIDVGTSNITVFAVKDVTESTLEATEGISSENISRHIALGIHSLPKTEEDVVNITTLAKEPITLTKKGDKIYVNGIEMISTPTVAGNSQIFNIAAVIPSTPATVANFTVYEANEEWAEGEEEKVLSAGTHIFFYELKDDEYVKVDSITTDAEGKAALSHYYTEGLFYSVNKEGKTSVRDNFQVTGLFTTQAQLDEAPEYKTGTALDDIKLGSLVLADIDGDGIINENDKIESGYLQLDVKAENTDVFIVSAEYGVEPEE